MKNDLSEMPITSYVNLRIDKPVEESMKKECFPESFMKEFTHGNEDDETADDEVLDDTDGVEDGSEEFSVLAANAGKGVAELLIDPVFQGWRKALRITGYMQGWRTR